MKVMDEGVDLLTGQLHLEDDGDGGLRIPSCVETHVPQHAGVEEAGGGEVMVQNQRANLPPIAGSSEPSINNRDEGEFLALLGAMKTRADSYCEFCLRPPS
jgi:hypothetical protein